MTRLAAIGLLLLPVVVTGVGAWVLNKASSRHLVKKQLENAPPEDRKALNQRLRYDRDAVSRHWGALAGGDPAHRSKAQAEALQAEKRFLDLDLGFPFFYGAALAASLLLARAWLGLPYHAAWFVAPVAVAALADWTENLVLRSQLSRFKDEGAEALDGAWIQAASVATFLKLAFFTGSFLLVVALTGALLVRKVD